jgi:hypothetical protein
MYSQTLENVAPDSAAGWKKSNPAKIYSGEELFSLIDGGADIFFEYGFKRVMSQIYNKADNYVNVEIYEMNDSSSAFGIFSLQTLKTGERIKFSCEASAGEGFLLFWKGNYYVTLSSSSSGNAGDNMAGLLGVAEGIQAKISKSGKPALPLLIEQQLNKKPVYLKGYLSLYNLYLFASENIFKVKEGCYFEGEKTKSFIFTYNNDADAANQFKSASDVLKMNNALISRPANNTDQLLLRESSGNFIKAVRFGKYILAFISEQTETSDTYIESIKKILN